MARCIAILWLISALGFSNADAKQISANVNPALAEGFSPSRQLATSGNDLYDASHAQIGGSDTMAQQSTGPDMRASRPPVPFLRQPQPAVSVPLQPDVPEVRSEEDSQDALDMEAAKAAIERDGYRKVMVLGKAGSGAWRARAYRGVAEVILRVDSHGSVSAE